MKKILTVSSFILLLLCSCTKDVNVIKEELPEVNQSTIDYGYLPQLKIEFAQALAQALKEHVALRRFLKKEALKMFDKDYDVLYQLVKNERVSDGLTFRSVLVSYFPNESKLIEIERQLPLLTIFVPELPEGSFSAKNWNADEEVPQIGIRLNNSNDVPIIDNQGNISILEPSKIPGFPTIVVKDNERVVISSNQHTNIKGSKIKTMDSDYEFQFLDDAFNGFIKEEELVAKRTTTSIDQKLIDAYNIYKNVDGWHRDYIYYDLTPGNTKGEFLYDFQEYITTFSLNGNPNDVYNKISDQSSSPNNDPTINAVKLGKDAASWTGGNYEFKVRALINAKNGVGSEVITYFSANPNQLFDLKYRKAWLNIYTLESIALKEMKLNLPIFNWDLNQYASSIKLEIEEVDITVTSVITDTRTVKFANNFSIDGGALKKIGLKFGASLETTTTQTIQRTFTEGNDHLGSIIINFADDIILSSSGDSGGGSGPIGEEDDGPIELPEDPVFKDTKSGTTTYTTRTYATGWYKLSLEPFRVQ